MKRRHQTAGGVVRLVKGDHYRAEKAEARNRVEQLVSSFLTSALSAIFFGRATPGFQWAAKNRFDKGIVS